MPQLLASAQALHIFSQGQSSSASDPRLPARLAAREDLPNGQCMGKDSGRAHSEGLQGQGLLPLLSYATALPPAALSHQLGDTSHLL